MARKNAGKRTPYRVRANIPCQDCPERQQLFLSRPEETHVLAFLESQQSMF
jgi:hypothetical protein